MTTLQTKLYSTGSYWNSFHTAEYLNPNITDTHNHKIFTNTNNATATWLAKKGNDGFQTGNSTQFGYNSYKPIPNNIIQANEAYWTALTKQNDQPTQIGQARAKEFEYHTDYTGVVNFRGDA